MPSPLPSCAIPPETPNDSEGESEEDVRGTRARTTGVQDTGVSRYNASWIPEHLYDTVWSILYA